MYPRSSVATVVRLNHPPADVRVALVRAAPIIGEGRDAGDEERHVLRVVRIADVDDAHADVEVRDEDELLIERRPELLISGVQAEAAALIAEFRYGTWNVDWGLPVWFGLPASRAASSSARSVTSVRNVR